MACASGDAKYCRRAAFSFLAFGDAYTPTALDAATPFPQPIVIRSLQRFCDNHLTGQRKLDKESFML
jgi:hypothetical protein